MKSLLLFAAALPSIFAQQRSPNWDNLLSFMVNSATNRSLMNQPVSAGKDGWLGLWPGARTSWSTSTVFYWEYLNNTKTFAIHRDPIVESRVTYRGKAGSGLLGLHTGGLPWIEKPPAGEIEGFDEFVIEPNTGIVTIKNGLEKEQPNRKWVVYTPKGFAPDQLVVGFWDGVTVHPDLTYEEVQLIAVRGHD